MYLVLLFVLQNKMFIRFFDGLWKNLESTQGMKLSLPFLTFILCVLPLFFHLEFTKIYQQKILIQNLTLCHRISNVGEI